jgi:hypothetical protein
LEQFEALRKRHLSLRVPIATAPATAQVQRVSIATDGAQANGRSGSGAFDDQGQEVQVQQVQKFLEP